MGNSEIIGTTVYTTLKHGVLIWDLEDFHKFGHIQWGINHGLEPWSYRVRCGNYKSKGLSSPYLHRLIMNAKKGEIVDHINRNTLDNRKENLRICSNMQNTWNAGSRKGLSKYKGVTYIRRSNKWGASIGCNGKRISLGHFELERDAALAYNAKAVELFGEFACLNVVA